MAISVTEPGGGTDLLGAMKTTATKADGGYKITGQKIWSTAAHVVAVPAAARPHRPDDADKPSKGVTIFLVPNPSEGLEIRQIPKVGMRCVGSCEVFLDEVFVPGELRHR